MARSASIPRLYVKSGQWVVTLRDPRTSARRTVYLRVPDSPDARRAYAETIAAWEAGDRVVKPSRTSVRRKVHRGTQTVVSSVVLAFWTATKSRHMRDGKLTAHGEAMTLGRKASGAG